MKKLIRFSFVSVVSVVLLFHAIAFAPEISGPFISPLDMTANRIDASKISQGPLPVTIGGTGLSASTINQLLYSSANNTIAGLATANNGILVTSGTGVPSIATDIPTAVTIGTAYIYRAGGTAVPITDGGTGASSLANLIALTTDTTGNYAAGDAEAGNALTGDSATGFFSTGALEATVGGTGQTVYAVGDLLYASTTAALSRLADVATGSYLASGGAGVAPAWAILNQAAVTGLTTADSPTFSKVTTNIGMFIAGDDGTGVASQVGLTNATTAYVDGTGTQTPKGVTGAGNPTFAGWLKLYNGTSVVYVPYYSVIQ